MANNAILFNGAASLIAQEAGILDLLLGNVEGVTGVLNIPDVKFVGGLSSGALMTFTFNAAFSGNSALTWDQFKKEYLFTLTTDKVYKDAVYSIQSTTAPSYKYDTTPLQAFLREIATKVGYKVLSNLPFDSAILVVNKSPYTNTAAFTYWLTNIPKVAGKLPLATYKVGKNIKAHQTEIELVSALMCSTAIPLGIFPPQQLFYQEGGNNFPINNENDQPAQFVDGGTLGIFKRFKEFFRAYEEHFDNIFVISPDYIQTDAETLRGSALSKSGSSQEGDEKAKDAGLLMNDFTKEFLSNLKDYNATNPVADKIYFCKPQIQKYNVLDFNLEKEQYDATIKWGQANPDKIAIDLSTMDVDQLN